MDTGAGSPNAKRRCTRQSAHDADNDTPANATDAEDDAAAANGPTAGAAARATAGDDDDDGGGDDDDDDDDDDLACVRAKKPGGAKAGWLRAESVVPDDLATRKCALNEIKRELKHRMISAGTSKMERAHHQRLLAARLTALWKLTNDDKEVSVTQLPTLPSKEEWYEDALAVKSADNRFRGVYQFDAEMERRSYTVIERAPSAAAATPAATNDSGDDDAPDAPTAAADGAPCAKRRRCAPLTTIMAEDGAAALAALVALAPVGQGAENATLRP